jgi:hypothetical protein
MQLGDKGQEHMLIQGHRKVNKDFDSSSPNGSYDAPLKAVSHGRRGRIGDIGTLTVPDLQNPGQLELDASRVARMV